MMVRKSNKKQMEWVEASNRAAGELTDWAKQHDDAARALYYVWKKHYAQVGYKELGRIVTTLPSRGLGV